MEFDKQWRFAQLCRLLAEGVPIALRAVFNGMHPPLFLVTSLLKPQTLVYLKRMRSYGVLSDTQWRALFPPHKAKPTSESFNAVLLSALLKFVCCLPAPYPSGWNGAPGPDDVSMAADVVRLRILRVTLASREDERVNEEEYNKHWKQIVEALERLGGRKRPQFNKDMEAGQEHVKKLKDWDKGAKEAEETEMKVEGSIRKKTNDKDLPTQDTSDTLKDFIKQSGQPQKKRFGKPASHKNITGHPGMKPEELRQHETAVLQQFQKQIIESVYADELVSKLIQRGILSHEDKNRINLATRNTDRIKLILEMIPKKSTNGAFDKFCDVIKYKHTVLYEQLLKAKQAPFVREKPDECTTCSNVMRTHYTETLEQCQPLPWQPDTHVSREEFLVPYFISDHTGRTYEMKGIFDRNGRDEKPRKILLEGSSGTGKSTLCASLAYTWGKKQLSDAFRLAFYIDLKMAKDDLLECIRQQCLPQDHEDRGLGQLIENNQRETLFILDGYENLPNPDSDIYDLIHRQLYPKSTVLMTAESAFITRPLAKLFDTRLLISGITTESQEELIHEYCKLTNNHCEKFKQLRNIVKTDPTANMLSQKPLFCLCMCFVAEYGGNLSFKCMTDLLQEYLVTLQKVFCKVNLLQMVDGALPDELQILTSTVEEKAFESLVNHHVVFSADDLVEQFRSKMEPWFNIRDQDIFRVGLIQIHEGNQQECHFSNRIFQEFLSAHNLANQDASQVLNLEDTLMTERHTANVLPLYCGIQSILENEDALAPVAEWLAAHTKDNQQAQPLSNKRLVLQSHVGKMEAKLSSLSLPLACLQESKAAATIAEKLMEVMPARIVMKQGELHHTNTLQGLQRMLGASHSELTELELRLNHLAHYQKPLFLQLAKALQTSQHVSCLKLCWTNADLMAGFLATMFGENRVLSQLSINDDNGAATDCITATVWSNLQKAGANMGAIKTISFTHCSNLALVTSVIRHIPASVEHVFFDECHVDLAGAQSLCAQIEQASSLETLSLARVKINRADFLKVMLGIRLNRTLKSLNLQGIDLDFTSVKTLSETLKFNGSLTRLDLSTVRLSIEGCQQLGMALSINQSLREVCLDGCGLSDDALDMLMKLKRACLRLTGAKRKTNISVSDLYFSRSGTLFPNITPQGLRQEATVI